MTNRMVNKLFENFLEAKIFFVQEIAKASEKLQTCDVLLKQNIMFYLASLLEDTSPKVQLYASITISRLVNVRAEAAKECVDLGLLPILLKRIESRSSYNKKVVTFAFRGIAKHSPELAKLLLQPNVLAGIIVCIKDGETNVKESAAWVIGEIIKHSVTHAKVAVNAGVVPLLKLALEDPDICLKQVAAATLGDIARQDVLLAKTVIDAGCIPSLAKSLIGPSPILKRAVLCCLSNIAKHSIAMAADILEAGVLYETLLNLGSDDHDVRKVSSSLVCEMVKHHVDFSLLVVSSGGLGGLLYMISNSHNAFPALLAIGHICSKSDQLAKAAINSNAMEVLKDVIESDTTSEIKNAAVWAVGQTGKHSAAHAEQVASSALLAVLVEYIKPDIPQLLKTNCRETLKQVIKRCISMSALSKLMNLAPPEVLKCIIRQFVKIIPRCTDTRKDFVTTGCLKKMMKIKVKPGSKLSEGIKKVSSYYPENVVYYFSPKYQQVLLQKIDQFTPIYPEKVPKDFDDLENVEVAQPYYSLSLDGSLYRQ